MTPGKEQTRVVARIKADLAQLLRVLDHLLELLVLQEVLALLVVLECLDGRLVQGCFAALGGDEDEGVAFTAEMVGWVGL